MLGAQASGKVFWGGQTAGEDGIRERKGYGRSAFQGPCEAYRLVRLVQQEVRDEREEAGVFLMGRPRNVPRSFHNLGDVVGNFANAESLFVGRSGSRSLMSSEQPWDRSKT